MPRRILQIFCISLLLSISGAVTLVHAQGTFGVPKVMNTATGESLITRSVSFVTGSSVVNPMLQMKVGFATDELAGPGSIFDSFTITLQDDLFETTLVLLSMDAFGTVFAPPTPGTGPVDESTILRTAIAYPSLTPLLVQQSAFEIEMALPQSLVGRSVTAYFDLFNNQDNRPSQAFFQDLQVVPEPSTWWLLVIGGGLLIWWRKKAAEFAPIPATTSAISNQ